MIPSILAWLVIGVAIPLNLYVAVRLLRLSRAEPTLKVLRERALLAVHSALVVTIFGIVFLNNGMEAPLLNQEQTQLLTRFAILSLVIPPLRWLFLYWRR